MNFWITFIASVVLAFKFGLTVSNVARKTNGTYKGGKAFIVFFFLIVGMNVLVSAVAKPLPILALILAVVYTAFIVYLMWAVDLARILVRKEVAQILDPKEDNEHDGERLGEYVDDRLGTARKLLAVFYLEVPMAVNILFVRAVMKGKNFLNPWQTIKGLVWSFVIPLIVIFLVGLFRYFWLTGLRELVINNDEYEDDEADEDGEYDVADEDGEDDEADEYDEYDEGEEDNDLRQGGASAWLKQNWLALASLILVLGTLVTCVTIVLKTLSS